MSVLTVNGKQEVYVPESFPATLQALIEQKGLQARAVVAEVDGMIVPREDFARRTLAPGSRVELVQLVGGG